MGEWNGLRGVDFRDGVDKGGSLEQSGSVGCPGRGTRVWNKILDE